MKKLLFVATASLCATVFGAIESSNVVGYQLIKVPTGYTLFTPTFDGIATDLDLTSIAVCDSTGAVNESYNEVNIQKMDSLGAYLDVYSYCSEVGGWNVDYSPIAAGEVTFKVGESICVANDTGDDVYFRVSGKVDLVNKNEVGEGYVLWGNSTPVAIDITQVTIVDENGNERTDLYNDVNIQKMDTVGAYLDVYGYCPEVGGWNVDYSPIAEGEFTLEPGESVCVANDSGSTIYFKLPRPITK